ncbi:hypothetical protein Ocin01_13553 [Orchesella cincta]|uniref:Nuclear pore complex protein n=1 Tax=Orchesella cincta TaxID=48709 RepID=A0A1D2MJF2_ORCCI|nr:hypothetical protein Ocin01_13553 [Orchesella cincta]
MKVLEQGTSGNVPVSDVVIGSGELWLLPKELYEMLERITKEPEPSDQLISEVDRLLTRHSADFASLFGIKPRNPVDREELKKCGKEGTYLKGYSGKHVIDYMLVNEAMLLSDMFQINEFLALDLLTVAENEIENYPGWPRGLIAVSMFYEGRLSLIASLVKMMRICPGRTWNSRMHPNILQLFRRTLNSVYREDMMDRLVVLLEQYNLDKEIDILDSRLALGDFRHRQTIKKVILDIREGIANCIFCYGAQKEVRWAEVMRVLDYIKLHICREERRIMRDDVILIAAVLFAIDHNLHPSDCNVTFGLSLRKYLRDNDNSFKCMEMWDLFRLSFLINAHKAPADAQTTSPLPPSAGPHGDSFLNPIAPTAKSLLEEDTEFEFTRNVFGFLQREIFSKPEFYVSDEIISRVFHGYFTDFIIHMPLKLKEIKYRSEEAVRTTLICQDQGILTGLQNVPEYESFLECLGEFYGHDQYELGSFFFLDDDVQCLPLSKLVRSCCLESPALFLCAMRFLAGVSNGNPAAMFDLLRQNGHNASLEHFFDSILRYINTYHSNSMDEYAAQGLGRAQPSFFAMNPVEIKGFCAYLQLVETVCAKHEGARAFFTSQKPMWVRNIMEMSKVRKIPREIRASMLNTLSAMIGDEILAPETVSTLWDIFYSARLIDPGTGDVKDELDEMETRLEHYSLTIGMLKMMKSLIKTRFRQMEFVSLEGYFVHPTLDNGAIFPYINYVIDHVFLKAPYRVYKNPAQRWEVLKLSASIISILLDYVPNLMLQLLCESPLIKTLLNVIADCALMHEVSHSTTDGLHVHIDQCSLECLNLLCRALQRQPFYLMQRREITGVSGSVLVGIHELTMTIGMDSGKPEYILSLLRFIDTLMTPEHRLAAINILCLIVDGHSELDSHIHAALEWQEDLAAVFRHTLIETLYDQTVMNGNTGEELKLSVLKLLRTSVQHPDPNIGFYLLGVDSNKMDYQEGIRTLLHGLLDTACQVPTSFVTLLTLMRDPRLSTPTLRYLRYVKFFIPFIEEGSNLFQEMSFEALCYFMKCLAVELKTEGGLNTASILATTCFSKLEEVLDRIELENHSVEMPDLEFFDGGLVMQAISSCEFVDAELKTRLIRVEMLDGMLKDEIQKLEKSTVLRLRKTVHTEAKEILNFARQLNACREKEGRKLLVFDGWRQAVEVLMLTPNLPMKYDFVTNVLRLLLNKVHTTSTASTDYFHRLAAETSLMGTAILKQIGEGEPLHQVARHGFLLSNIINNLAQWISTAQSPKVRGILYAAVLHAVNMLPSTSPETTMTVCQQSFPLILDSVARDCCQAQETGKLQALYLLGEVVRCATHRGLSAAASSAAAANAIASSSQWPDDEVDGDASYSMADVEHHNRTLDSVSSFDMSFVGGVDKTAMSSTRLQPKTPGQSSSTMGMRGSDSSLNFGKKQPNFHYRTASEVGEASSTGPMMNRASVTNSILSCVLNNSFLSTIVESFCVVDDLDLVALLTTQLNQNAMRAFFVFEAKMSMLTRLANSGLRAVLHLLDLNLIKRLMDMKVFELHNYQTDVGDEENADGGRAGDRDQSEVVYSRKGNEWDSTNPNQSALGGGYQGQGRDGGRGSMEITSSQQNISESLFAQVFKLFHVMLDSAPRNVMVLEQILQFFKRHDEAVSKCLSQRALFHSGNNLDKPSAFLLTSLMTKLSPRLPAAASPSGLKIFSTKSSLKLSLLNILRIQAERNRTTELLINMVKNVLLFLYYHSRSKESSRGGPSEKPQPKRCIVLTKKLEMDHLLRDPEENCSIGVIIQLVSDCATHITNSQFPEKVSVVGGVPAAAQQKTGTELGSASSSMQFLPEKVVQDMSVIVEVGLSIVFFHAELFIQEFPAQRRTEAKQWKQQLQERVEGILAKQVTDACKKIPQSEYTETMLLKLRRLAVGTTFSSASTTSS